MALPDKITKIDLAALLDISRVTLDKRIEDGVYSWPATSWAAAVAEHVTFEKDGQATPDDARFRRARADSHEIDAAVKRGAVAPIALFEEQIVHMFGLFVQELQGAEARLLRSAGLSPLAEAIRNECRGCHEGLARSLERYCESLEERSRRSETGAEPRRRGVGASGASATAG